VDYDAKGKVVKVTKMHSAALRQNNGDIENLR
jgi:hypothetical protein